MNSIRIVTTRNIRRGVLFHYAPFLLHCLFPEIINEVYNYKEVIREKNLDQTIGNFHKIYTEVMGNSNLELDKQNFINHNSEILSCEFNRNYFNKEYFDKFRNYIFGKYQINPNFRDINYPEILLIKRWERTNLIEDPELKSKMPLHAMMTGKERREIDRIDDIEQHLKNKYGEKFGSVHLELIPFKEQIRYFNNAKYIIGSHGGGLANLIFCSEGTRVVEVSKNPNYDLFFGISKTLNLQHINCEQNNFDTIIHYI